MAPEDIALILTALVGGGALYKMIEGLALIIANKGKSAREEFRDEITRLEAKLREQEHKIEKLQEEIDRQKDENNIYREKNLQLMATIQHLELIIERKDHRIETLENRARLLKLAQCSHIETCPLVEEGEEKETKK